MTFDGDSLPPLRDVIRLNGLDARKGLGQHFLLDLNMTRKIARAAGDLSGRDVLEIGPGPGGLTRALLESDADRVVAVERDARCIAALANVVEAASPRLELVEGDALEADARALVRQGAAIVANLPYNVRTPLLFQWLDMPAFFGHGADVPVGGRRAHYRCARHKTLRTPCCDGELAVAGTETVRTARAGLHATAESRFCRCAVDPQSRTVGRSRRRHPVSGRRGGIQSAAQDAASKPEGAWRGRWRHCWKQPPLIRRAARGNAFHRGILRTCSRPLGRAVDFRQAADKSARPGCRSPFTRSACRIARTSARQ